MRYLLDRCIRTNERELGGHNLLSGVTQHPNHHCTWIVKTIFFLSPSCPVSQAFIRARVSSNACWMLPAGQPCGWQHRASSRYIRCF